MHVMDVACEKLVMLEVQITIVVFNDALEVVENAVKIQELKILVDHVIVDIMVNKIMVTKVEKIV